MRFRLWRWFVLGLAIGIPGVWLSSAQSPSRVDPAVAQLLQADGSAEVIVTLHDPATAMTALSLRKQLVVAEIESVLRELSARDFQLRRRFETIAAFAGILSPSGLAKLERHPKVLRIEPDIMLYALQHKLQPQLSESVPLIQAHSVHNLGIRGNGVRIAILDTGIDTDHPDFSAVTPGDRIVAQNCFLTGASCPPPPNVAEDGNGHAPTSPASRLQMAPWPLSASLHKPSSSPSRSCAITAADISQMP
ncbi:MAG: S8 family serine peptidase [Candidatus Bipolaricaulota bacterium]|nr:S8 family serine peptidase [Candidatus Bipolaricaulota bacterium]MDW8030982.1 S8 family serine peptidase [Candidatus Bipolaricaulota bacterium]